jgi:sugar/nucleoside kinase (ribokinase family)
MRPLATLGNVNVDLIMGPTTPWPRPGTEVLVAHDELRPGGAAGNTALAWAGMEVPFTIASNVGNDAFGMWLINAFRPHSGAWVISPCHTTVSVGLTHPGDERTFFTTRGHLPELGWHEARPQLEQLDGGLLLLSGSFLMDKLAADYSALFTWAADRGVEIALDPGWPVAGWTAAELSRARTWVGATRHLLINEVEAMALAGADDLETALPTLADLLPDGATVVVKAGPKGAYAWQGGTVHHTVAPEVLVVDTIGAGDVFNAGYLLAIAEGATLPKALETGVILASRVISTSPRRYERPAGLRERVG